MNVRWPYVVGTRAEYKCPKGYGLDGIPYRICTEDGSWEPVTRRHICVGKRNLTGDSRETRIQEKDRDNCI